MNIILYEKGHIAKLMQRRNQTFEPPKYKLYNSTYLIKGEISNVSGVNPGFTAIRKPEEFNYGIVDVVPVRDKTLSPPIISLSKM